MMLTAWNNALMPYGAFGPRSERENPLTIRFSKYQIHLIFEPKSHLISCSKKKSLYFLFCKQRRLWRQSSYLLLYIQSVMARVPPNIY